MTDTAADPPTARAPSGALPVGTVTFLFTDIEGSTRLSQSLGAVRYGTLLERHRTLLRDAFRSAGGVEIGTEGDSFFVVFERASNAAVAAADAQRRLASEPWEPEAEIRVRMGIHSGEGILADGSYVGNDVNRAARIAAAGHGGQILVSETTSALVTDTLPTGVSLRSLGEHRLKDMRPERLCQLVVEGLPADFPMIRSLDAARNNLPTQLTSFVGREAELAEAGALLSKARLLTLTGPGGTGKTRLSLELAARAADGFRDGVYFVPLEPITEASLVPGTIAQAVGLVDRGGQDPVARLIDHLGARRILLVLDNLEQVSGPARVVGELLAGAAGLTVLATSRAALHVHGEVEYPVPPLGVPDRRGAADPDGIARYESVALFVERATAARPAFRLTSENASAVAEICNRLDGLPLAIELAAARIKLLSPQAILSRLENRLSLLSGGAADLPARQQTLRGAIAWSYDLLDEADRALFATLSVFVGGATLDAIEAVCRPGLDRDVLDGVASLVDKSLLRQIDAPDGEPRFAMLETIRDYATEQLDAEGRGDAVRERHAAWFLELAESSAGRLLTADNRETLDRLELEHDNLRAALAWATTPERASTGLRIGASLWRFWQMRGYLTEGLTRLQAVLAFPECMDFEDERLGALDAAGGLAYWQGDHVTSRVYYAEALETRRRRGDAGGIAESLYNLSFQYTFTGEYDEARALAEEALALFESVGDAMGVARARWALANLAYTTGRYRDARDLAGQALVTFEAVGDSFMTTWASFTLGIATMLDGEMDEARRLFGGTLARFTESADVSGYTLVLDSLAVHALRSGNRERAARIAGAVARLERITGTGLNPRTRSVFQYDPAELKTAPDTATAYEEGERMDVDAIVAYAQADT
ncbi:MAG TPA: tetratricopeptide repeat protein [Candidatus Limnocylindrales bacterium]